jgi:hypothetical protein
MEWAIGGEGEEFASAGEPVGADFVAREIVLYQPRIGRSWLEGGQLIGPGADQHAGREA